MKIIDSELYDGFLRMREAIGTNAEMGRILGLSRAHIGRIINKVTLYLNDPTWRRVEKELRPYLRTDHVPMAKPAPAPNRDGGDKKKKIIRDLAERIEKQAIARFASQVDSIREGLLRILRNSFYHSNDETLEKIGVLILSHGEIDETAIMAAVRECNSTLVASERDLMKYPE